MAFNLQFLNIRNVFNGYDASSSPPQISKVLFAFSKYQNILSRTGYTVRLNNICLLDIIGYTCRTYLKSL
jgi:hypothetical protein